MKASTGKLLEKAQRSIDAAQVLLDSTGPEFAAGRCYYSMFYVAEALLHERGQRFSRHSAVQAAYGKEFAKTGVLPPEFHRWLLQAFNARLDADYGFEADIGEEDVRNTLERARAFLVAARDYLTRNDNVGE